MTGRGFVGAPRALLTIVPWWLVPSLLFKRLDETSEERSV